MISVHDYNDENQSDSDYEVKQE